MRSHPIGSQLPYGMGWSTTSSKAASPEGVRRIVAIRSCRPGWWSQIDALECSVDIEHALPDVVDPDPTPLCCISLERGTSKDLRSEEDGAMLFDPR